MNIIPGPLNLVTSTYVEESPDYGCIIQETCYARYRPRDDANNLLWVEDLIIEEEYSLILKGPIGTGEEVATVIATLEPDDTEYLIGLDFARSGLWYLFFRVNGTDVPDFPLQI